MTMSHGINLHDTGRLNLLRSTTKNSERKWLDTFFIVNEQNGPVYQELYVFFKKEKNSPLSTLYTIIQNEFLELFFSPESFIRNIFNVENSFEDSYHSI